MSEPGGRTKSISMNGAVFDLGAQWIGHPQKYTIELAERSKNETI
jgi:phytoene dehydrogenase-like protein